MSGHRKFADIRKDRDDPKRQARVAQYRREFQDAISLAELRRARELTQAQLGTALEMPQSAVSRLERQTDLYVSTLRSYVEAMGGQLAVEAVFDDKRRVISTFSSLGSDTEPQQAEYPVLPETNTPDPQPLLQLNDDLQRLARELVPATCPIPGDLLTREQSIAIFALTKACKTHAALVALCRAGYGEDASILARSLFELALDVLYSSQDPTGERAERYVDHDWVIRYEMLHTIRTDPALKGMRQPEDTTVAEIEREAHRVQNRWQFWNEQNKSGRLKRPKSHWSGKTIRDVAAAVGWESHYNTMYRLVSQLAHTSVRGANQYIAQIDEHTLRLNSGPSTNYVWQTLFSGFVYLHQTMQFWRVHIRPDDRTLEERLAALDQAIIDELHRS